jgi:hypothetical protein
MFRSAFLLFSLFLFALSPAASAQTANGAQVAQSGERCASYGKANNCAARWDRRTKACTCVG